MNIDPATKAALERLRRVEGAEILPVYLPLSTMKPDMAPYDAQDMWHEDTHAAAMLALAWTDPTPLTLDVLRKELGEPWAQTYGDRDAWQSNDFGSPRFIHDPQRSSVECGTMTIATLGQLRRVLSVVAETTHPRGPGRKERGMKTNHATKAELLQIGETIRSSVRILRERTVRLDVALALQEVIEASKKLDATIELALPAVDAAPAPQEATK